jgi:hypothetical protein
LTRMPVFKLDTVSACESRPGWSFGVLGDTQ